MDPPQSGSGPEAEPTKSLKSKVVSKVAPSFVTEHPEFIYPSVVDIYVLDIYMPVLSLYRLDTTLPWAFSDFVRNLKDSLSKVLSLYYPMAGKWVVAEDLYIRKLHCSDEGPVFVEATVDDDMDKYFDFDHDLNPPPDLYGESSIPGISLEDPQYMPANKEWPSLIIQVTGFKCGGVALIVSFNHMLTDGFSFDRFLKAWSEIAATGQTSMKPNFDRSSLPSLLNKGQKYGLSTDMKNVDDVLSNMFRNFPPIHDPRSVSKCYDIKSDAVERIRQKAKEGHASEKLELPERFTNFECISTQMWRCFSRLPSGHERMTSKNKVHFLFPVEGRKRMCNPPLPDDYVGNMLLSVAPPIMTGPELCEKSYACAACEIHKSILSLNTETAWMRIDEQTKGTIQMTLTPRENLPETQSEKPDASPTPFACALSSWIRFTNLYNLDFGFGVPFRVTLCSLHTIPDFPLAYFLPPRPQSGDVASLFLRSSPWMADLLLQDPEFQDFVS
ncbi:hypothetical protein MPTK1_8g10610 [Marchantia polymorpha subsp. ruderalis]|uniref:Uncharacterized protein n=2 Tax=Marchantia polymorpha TaxID=3197 RepID=A0A176VJ19_MARPO|nr:hypothetical protein AXG93_3846s1060 [Marchantia polymorpha subsp. ruderalis]PTQ47408.1 hypothetical protein MARPO_0008s0162 [Marchantia polymorpha]BBN19424.1 hypothetical protein Mp_8g10610 [Marchantia polymorpha subsp. ruderalis]|eukprot:PTQ47408.1 hypothetical protein MARPO_0008s0162 [Marchantia polymorpha]